jgi:dihydrofolate reductase
MAIGGIVRKLVEVTHVTLGGEIGSPDAWAHPYLDDQHLRYASDLLEGADALLLGRRTYEGLSAAYPKMAEQSPPGVPNGFVDRMNQIPKFVASTTLRQATWNATVIDGEVAAFVANLKRQPGQNLLKYGTGPLDATLMKNGLIDEFHLLLTPVAVGRGQHLFEDIDWAPDLKIIDVTRFDSGVVALVYAPPKPSPLPLPHPTPPHPARPGPAVIVGQKPCHHTGNNPQSWAPRLAP